MDRKRRAIFGYPFQSASNYHYVLPNEDGSVDDNSEDGKRLILAS